MTTGTTTRCNFAAWLTDNKQKENIMKLHTVDITPTWVAVMPVMLAVISDPNASPMAVEAVTAVLMRLAAIGDDAKADD
jgi:hypothetical protein